MERATARLWREGTRWIIQIDIDGARYTERDYDDIANACHAIASILRQRGERPIDLDEDECEACDEPLDLLTCAQCGLDAFVRGCDHGEARPIRLVGDRPYCRTCRS
jgi:hypothetical protein